ncbi:branched-chain amino acid ABC transporter permease [Rugosimonospora acidiphila]|uniref:Branched-chain amino acid ABC transporter permease n=1 Tax=Rugosimonospora acidiphila TaxID=556531 RepID=A0ABP9RNI1_9ACTN
MAAESRVDVTGKPAAAPPTPADEPDGWRRLRPATPWAIGAIAVLAVIALQTQLYSGQVRTVSTVLMFIALAQSWNILGGFTGYASFGQVAFFGLGGYSTAVLMAKAGLSYWMALPLSAVIAAAFAAVIGLPLLRLRGHYFAIATLGVAEGLREIVINVPRLTGGGAGISIPVVGKHASTAYLGNDTFYIVFLVVAAATTVLVGVLSRSRLGYGLRAIRQDEAAAAAAGIDTTRAKVTALVLSAFCTGLVGSVYAFQQVTIYPERLFDVQITLLMVMMVVIGGSGTVLGPIIGATALQALSEYLRANFTEVHTFILGAIIIAAVIILPQGAVFFIRDAWRTRRLPLLDNVRTYRL